MLTNHFHPYCKRVFALLLTAMLVSSCDDDGAGKKHSARQQTVAVVTVQHAPLTIDRQLTGSLEPIAKVHIISEAQGRIAQLLLFPGDRVEKGQLLIHLDDAVVKAELGKATATYKQAKLNLKRIQRLKPRKLASEDQIARAQTALELARSEVSLWRTRLGHTRIEAPFSGVISKRLKEQGDVVSLNDHILTLIDDSALKARIRVSEYLLSQLHKETAVRVVVDALGDQVFPGKILRVYPAIDPNTRLGTAEILLSPVPPNARSGQLCRVNLGVTTVPLLSLPFAAIKHDSRGDYVFAIDKQGKARYTPITTGLQAGDHIQVVKGLKNGASVITKGHIGLRDGKSVKVTGKNNKVNITNGLSTKPTKKH